ncbi:hypothetical protein EV426DRAFT_612718 [Tirmania nivea]|nr:hypothetical protein EV426DRAFT_612718 [Tirmania nivea]
MIEAGVVAIVWWWWLQTPVKVVCARWIFCTIRNYGFYMVYAVFASPVRFMHEASRGVGINLDLESKRLTVRNVNQLTMPLLVDTREQR